MTFSFKNPVAVCCGIRLHRCLFSKKRQDIKHKQASKWSSKANILKHNSKLEKPQNWEGKQTKRKKRKEKKHAWLMAYPIVFDKSRDYPRNNPSLGRLYAPLFEIEEINIHWWHMLARWGFSFVVNLVSFEHRSIVLSSFRLPLITF